MFEEHKTLVKILLLGFYFPLLSAIAVLILYKVKLLISYLWHRSNNPAPEKEWDKLPFVTIQLPLYNEQNVIDRLIESATSIDYPKERFEIQVLDDSTDNSIEISRACVEAYKKKGFDINLYHRTNRHDFKAGALAEGLKVAKGEFVAVFDSDFIIPKSFLKETVHYFTSNEVGMVQCRWGFLNEKDTLLTRLQTSFLNGHFIIEHTARNRSGHFFNFNGTAGIWRKEAINSCGGWQGDTLTEDLDLSYRAQLAGWKFIYLRDLVAHSELPPTLDAYNGQQFRWVKGLTQVLIKMLPVLWRSNIPLAKKVDASCHLFSGAGYLFSVIISLLTVPILFFTKEYIDANFMWIALGFVFINCFMIWTYYFVAEVEARGWKRQTFVYPTLLLLLSIGFATNGLYAVKEAITGKKTPFIRTPKFNNKFTKYILSENNSSPVYKVIFFINIYFIALFALIFSSGKYFLLSAALFFAPGYLWMLLSRVRERMVFQSVLNEPGSK